MKKQNTLTYIMTALLAFVGTQGEPALSESKAESHIRNQVSSFGDTLNLTEILELLEGIKASSQHIYSQLLTLGDSDFGRAEQLAMEFRGTVAADYVVMAGMVSLIQRQLEVTTSEEVVTCYKALQAATTAAKSLLHLTDQITGDTESIVTSVDPVAMRHLLSVGNQAANQIH